MFNCLSLALSQWIKDCTDSGKYFLKSPLAMEGVCKHFEKKLSCLENLWVMIEVGYLLVLLVNLFVTKAILAEGGMVVKEMS